VTELKARRAIDVLRGLDAPTAIVVRRGLAKTIPAIGLVPGDLIILEAGQAVPADARLIESAELRTLESPLTGESMPVDKNAVRVLDGDTLLPDRTNMLFQGTAVVAGGARAVVTETGEATEMGRFGVLTAALVDEPTPLEVKLDTLGRRLVWFGLAIVIVVVAIERSRGTGWFEVLSLGVAMAVAAVPEGLPAVATIALAIGMSRLAKKHALVRRLPAIETLGEVTVVCTDKTGTLTTGAMTVTRLVVDGHEVRVAGVGYDPVGGFVADGEPITATDQPALGALLRVAMLANHAEIEQQDDGWSPVGDPTEAALIVVARKGGVDRRLLRHQFPEVDQVPFSSERMWMATFHQDGADLLACVKGAPDAILGRCVRVLGWDGLERELDGAARERLRAVNAHLAESGLRVLALARANVRRPGPDAVTDLTFLGFTGMADPPAPAVRETVGRLHDAGIRTLMLTGDQRLTAKAIADELALAPAAFRVLDAHELALIPDALLADWLRDTAAICRVSPGDKLRIVEALQRSGDIVAMLGDGVNDAAALRKADIGVAMGKRGTDAAKNAADMVLTDDRFATIAEAVEGGRVVFDNIRKFVFYLFSCNVGEILVLFVGGLVGLGAALTPLQILWINLVTDTFPALALAVEPAEAGIMRRAPRDPTHAILSGPFMRRVALYAALIAGATLAAFVVVGDGDVARGRTAAFMTLALAQALHLGNARSRDAVVKPARAIANRWALAAILSVFVLQGLAATVPGLRQALAISPLGTRDWGIVLLLSAAPAVVGQVMKLLHARPASIARVTAESSGQ
jgi:magnesium-transporting ATPase (P-type)